LPILIEQLGLAFFPIPKCACTSLKLTLFELEHHQPYSRARHGGPHIHRFYRKKRNFDTMAEVTAEDYGRCRGYWSFAVTRDPIKRLLSAYSNRIASRDDITMERQRNAARNVAPREPASLPARPTIDFFVENLEGYRRCSESIEHHTQPQRYFLGPDWRRIDRVYRIEEIADLEHDLSERTGRRVTIPRANDEGARIRFSSLSPCTQERLRELTRTEYDWLHPLYDPL